MWLPTIGLDGIFIKNKYFQSHLYISPTFKALFQGLPGHREPRFLFIWIGPNSFKNWNAQAANFLTEFRTGDVKALYFNPFNAESLRRGELYRPKHAPNIKRFDYCLTRCLNEQDTRCR